MSQSRALLQAMGSAPEYIAGLDPALETDPGADPERLGSEFYRIRQQIADQLRGHSVDGYRLSGPPVGGRDPDTIAGQMTRRPADASANSLHGRLQILVASGRTR